MSATHKFLGIEIGGTKLQLCVGDAYGRIEERIRYTIAPGDGAMAIQKQIEQGIQQLRSAREIAAVGVGFGGPVDWEAGCIRISHQVKGWDGFNFCQWLNLITNKPAVIENDANTAALAEGILGAGKGHDRVFYMTIGSGIGGGFILHGEIYHGKSPGEVEIGHIRMNKSGITLEDECSGWAVNKKVRTFIDQNKDSLLASLSFTQPAPEAALLKPALKAGDKGARQIMEAITDDLAFALSHIVHLFHPDIIIIGGGLSLLGEYLCLPVAKKLPPYIMKAFLPPPPVVIASLGEDVVPIGALTLASRRLQKT